MKKLFACGVALSSALAPLSPRFAASADVQRPVSLDVSATNPFVHPHGNAEHTLRRIGSAVAPGFSESHSVYSVQLFKWSGKPGHEKWVKLGRKQNVTVSGTTSLDAQGEDLNKLQIAISNEKNGNLKIPTDPLAGQMRSIDAEPPHVRLLLHFWSDKKQQELAQWLVESPLGSDSQRASTWKFQEIIASPLVTVSFPSSTDQCKSESCIIVKVAPR